jgi:hypothetical protein
MLKLIPSISVAAALFALSSLGATSAQAASLDFNGWDSIGDVTKSINSATLTNAAVDGSDDIGNQNLTGAAPVNPGSLNSNLGLFSDPLDSTAKEGSALYTELTVAANDVFTFNWSVFNLALDPKDRLFAAIGGKTFDLTGSAFSYTFATAGIVRVGVGVVDRVDNLNSSVLTITDANLSNATAVPSPALLPGMIGFGLSLIRKRRSAV